MYLSTYFYKKKYRNDKAGSNQVGYPPGLEGVRWKGLTLSFCRVLSLEAC